MRDLFEINIMLHNKVNLLKEETRQETTIKIINKSNNNMTETDKVRGSLSLKNTYVHSHFQLFGSPIQEFIWRLLFCKTPVGWINPLR